MQNQSLDRETPPIIIAPYLPPVHSYQNQREVAEGIKRAYKDVPGLKREDLFIVSLIHTDLGCYTISATDISLYRPPSCGTGMLSPTTLLHYKFIDPACSQHRPEVVEASLDACLAELELDYLDV